jgi:ATP sulfurylase
MITLEATSLATQKTKQLFEAKSWNQVVAFGT